jgi:D-alanine transaminase
MILLNEQLLPREEAHIDIEDRGYQFGDGVYEVIRVYHGKPFYLQEHLQRLWRSANAIQLKLSVSLEQLTQKIEELLTANQTKQGNIYLQVTRGVAARTHAFPSPRQPVLVAYTQPGERPIKALQGGIAAITTEDIRWLRCDIKSLNLLGAVLAKQKAVDQQAEEAILVRDGLVTEGSSTNVFLVEDNVLWTHPADHLILHGITRQIVLQLAAERKLTVKEVAFEKERLYTADECFITSTTMEVCPVVKIDDQLVNQGQPGSITRMLQEDFQQLITKQG